LADGCAGVVLDVFAPRNAAEFRRVLRPDGVLLVVTPQPAHLGELVAALGLLSVDPDKDRRLDEAMRRWFRLDQLTGYEHRLRLSRTHAGQLVAMGPSAWHTDRAQRATRLAALAEPIEVTAAISLRVYRPTTT
jgi:23S rRNA (guanine745-N1)-methyltransferase